MNILVFTTIYPIAGTKSGFTPIVKYFCEDWVKLGHRVVVISSTTRFPYLYYVLPKFVDNIIENKVGFNVPNTFSRKKKYVIENGVEVLQLPIKKQYPGQSITEEEVNYFFQDLLDNYLKNIDFVPDIATGHWVVPQINYLKRIKETFNIPTCLVLHTVPNEYEEKVITENINFIDLLGFRSESIQRKSNALMDLSSRRQFLCYSGVEDFYKKLEEDYRIKPVDKNCIKVCFVGNLISRKYPEVIVESLNSFPDLNFEIHYVGDGKMKDKIMQIKRSPNIKVHFYGRMPREEVYKVIEKSHFLVMISKDEAFGLVYLEAMLNRTIPIASFDEGFDGIIKDGINGYLCKAGSIEGLKSVFAKIIDSDVNDLYAIQKRSFETVKKMKNLEMATQYLNQF